MNVELTRFKVKDGRTEKVNEWLKFLNENMKDVLLTLEDEQMYVETIFREEIDGNEFLYWYSVQGEDGQDVQDSAHWIDKKHLEYWNECIDTNVEPYDLTTEVVMIPEKVRAGMKR